MRTYLDCYPCFMKQALRTGRIVTKDEEKLKDIMTRVCSLLTELSIDQTPPEIGGKVYQIIEDVTGVRDPYSEIKEKNIEFIENLYPDLEEIIANSADKLLAAIRLAIAGNVIDLGVSRHYNIFDVIKEIQTQEFAIFDYENFKRSLKNTKQILFLADNSGESVFDKLLIKQLKIPVTYAVKNKPVINDTTLEEAKRIKIDNVASLINSGSNAPGTVIDQCNKDFVKTFNSATMIISKGQGNFEALSETNAPIFFLLKAKCKIIAKDLNVKVDDIILKENENSN